MHYGKLFLQINATFVDHALRLAQVRIVVERCERARLRDAVHIEWLPRLVKHFDHIRPGNGIADPQPGEAMNLREGSQNNDVSFLVNVLQRVGWIIEEFKICFVENDNYVLGHARHEPVYRALRDQRAGRIVRVRNENETGFWRDRIQRRLQILLIIRARRFNRAHAESGREQFINDKRVLKGDYVIARIQKRVTEKFDHFI